MLALIVLIIRYLIMACLYIFLGWVVFSLWRELRFQSQVIAAKRIPEITLRLETGQESTSITFSKSEVVIGRAEECDFQLKEEVISSQHARLFYRSSQWWVEDLHSTNGTYLNDERVDTPTVIIKGDELRIGHQIISIGIQDV
jgi:pSer/pThr/pTyr-binding forkhead associated (FHA) protein